MPIPQFLASHENSNSGATNPQLYIYRDIDRIPLGVTTSTEAANATYLTTTIPTNHVVRHKQYIYWLTPVNSSSECGIYRSSDLGETWEFALDTNAAGGVIGNEQSYIFNMMIDGTPTLCWFGADGNSAQYRFSMSTDGTTWTTNSVTASTIGSGSAGFILFHSFTPVGNYLYFTGNTGSVTLNTSIVRIDWTKAGSVTIAESQEITASHPVGDFCQFNGKLYHFRLDGTSSATTTNIFEVSGLAMTVAQTFTHTAAGSLSTNNYAQWAAFSDGTNMYLFHYANNADGWLVKQIDSGLTVTDITSSVIPTYLSTNTGGQESRVHVMVDPLSDPTTPDIYLYCFNQDVDYGNQRSITPWFVYKWNGPSSLLTLEGGVGSIFDLITWNKTTRGGSQGYFQLYLDDKTSPHVEIIGKATQTNAVKIQFQLFSSDSTRTVKVSGFFEEKSTADALHPAQATLSNPSHGSLVSNVIENLTTDNGATTYLVTWESGTDGIANKESYIFTLKVENQ
jgi:hypothetical protein